MKLCVPSRDDRGLQSEIAQHFGRAPWFTIIDTEDDRVESRVNPDCHQHPGVCHHIAVLRALGVDAVAGARVGRRAWMGLRDAGIEVFATVASKVADVVAVVKAGTAMPMDETTACGGQGQGHGHGHEHEHGHGCDEGRGTRPHRRRRSREG